MIKLSKLSVTKIGLASKNVCQRSVSWNWRAKGTKNNNTVKSVFGLKDNICLTAEAKILSLTLLKPVVLNSLFSQFPVPSTLWPALCFIYHSASSFNDLLL